MSGDDRSKKEKAGKDIGSIGEGEKASLRR